MKGVRRIYYVLCELLEMLEMLEMARAAEKAAEAAQQDADRLKAAADAAADEKAAGDATIKLELELKEAGLTDEAEEMRMLLEALESGTMTGAELEQAAMDAHVLAEMLRVKGLLTVAADADDLSEKLSVAAKAKLEAEKAAKRHGVEVCSSCREAIRLCLVRQRAEEEADQAAAKAANAMFGMTLAGEMDRYGVTVNGALLSTADSASPC